MIDKGINTLYSLYFQTLVNLPTYSLEQKLARIELLLNHTEDKNPELQARVINILYSLNAHKEALVWLNKWHTNDPKNIQYSSMLTNLYLAMNQNEKAIEVTRKKYRSQS